MTARLKSLEGGEVLFRQGDPGGGLFLVKEGRLEVYREAESGGLVVPLAIVGPGEFLGTATLLSKEPRLASARALGASVVQVFDGEALATGMKDIPTWAVAVLKDTLARLKQVDELLVETAISEKKHQKRVGNSLTCASQFVFFLAALCRMGSVDDEGRTLFPLAGVAVRGEMVLRLQEPYLAALLAQMTKGGLFKTEVVGKYGECLVAPQVQVLEDFGHFLLHSEKDDCQGFVSLKFIPWMSALLRCAKRRGESTGHREVLPHSAWEAAELNAALAKDRGREVDDDLLPNLVAVKVLQAENLGKGGATPQVRYTFMPSLLQRRIVFESTARLMRDNQPLFL